MIEPEMPSATPDRRPAIAIALVSFASLLLELGLTRLFSVVLFYHFAFLAISVALLGIGAGGVFAFIRRGALERWPERQLGTWLCALNAIVILLVLEVVVHLPISLELTRGNFGKLTIVYLASAVPFFFVGVLFSVVFARARQGIGRLYGADLLGGALACLAIVPLLNIIGGPNAILFASLSMALAAAIWSESARARKVSVGIAAAFGVLIAANYNGRLIDIIYAKGVLRDRSQSWVEFARWNAISRVEVNKTGDARYIVIDADASTAIMNVDPARWEQAQDPPTNLNLIDREKNERAEGYNWKKDLMSAAPAIANVLRPSGKYAIIGPGGGVDVLRAVANGSKDVTAIEINQTIVNDIMRGRYADYAYHLYERPEVHLHVGDGRSFIRNSKDKYDVIQMTLVDTWASTSAGAFALSENNLYTVEAFEEYFDHLKDDGFIAITRWEFKEPREALRVVSQAMEALHHIGVPDPANHFIVISDGELNVDGRPVAVVAKKSRFSEAEIQQVRAHLGANPSLRSIYQPGQQTQLGETYEGAGRPSLFAFRTLIGQNNPHWTSHHYPYNITPVYDSNPFFFFTLKTEDVLKKIWSGTGRGMDWRINLGVTVLFMVFGISILAVLVFLVLPLLFFSRQSEPATRSGSVARLGYFIAVGLGFILVEIAFIQRFVLFLGHPTYALTVVVFLMLLASGCGSLVSRRWIQNSSRVWIPLLIIAAVVLVYIFLLPEVLGALIGQPFPLKLLISAALLVPLGFLMGMPFPVGLRALAEANDLRAEWAWALNGAATVLGSVSAMIIAIHFGLDTTLACGALAYLLAAVLRVRPARGSVEPALAASEALRA
jgi:spermidine synthase